MSCQNQVQFRTHKTKSFADIGFAGHAHSWSPEQHTSLHPSETIRHFFQKTHVGNPFKLPINSLSDRKIPLNQCLLYVIQITGIMIQYIIYFPKLVHSISHFLPSRQRLLYFTHGSQLLSILPFKTYLSTQRLKARRFI